MQTSILLLRDRAPLSSGEPVPMRGSDFPQHSFKVVPFRPSMLGEIYPSIHKDCGKSYVLVFKIMGGKQKRCI